MNTPDQNPKPQGWAESSSESAARIKRLEYHIDVLEAILKRFANTTSPYELKKLIEETREALNR